LVRCQVWSARRWSSRYLQGLIDVPILTSLPARVPGSSTMNAMGFRGSTGATGRTPQRLIPWIWTRTAAPLPGPEYLPVPFHYDVQNSCKMQRKNRQTSSPLRATEQIHRASVPGMLCSRREQIKFCPAAYSTAASPRIRPASWPPRLSVVYCPPRLQQLHGKTRGGRCLLWTGWLAAFDRLTRRHEESAWSRAQQHIDLVSLRQ